MTGLLESFALRRLEQLDESGTSSSVNFGALNGAPASFRRSSGEPSHGRRLGPGTSRSVASGGRRTYLSSASRPLSSSAPAWVAAWTLKPASRTASAGTSSESKVPRPETPPRLASTEPVPLTENLDTLFPWSP